jgi:hypothetical protein
MRRPAARVLLAAAGLVAFAVGLVANFPATLALAWFAPDEVRAWGVEGSVWAGRAASIAAGPVSLGQTRWGARLPAFLVLRPTWGVEADRGDGFLNGTVSIALFSDRQRFRDLEAALDLDSLPPSLSPDGTSGQLSLQFTELVLADGWPAIATGRAGLARLHLPGVQFELGPFEIVFPENDGFPVAAVRSLGGPLSVDGQLALPGPERWSLDLVLAPGEDAPRDLVQGLQFVGEEIPGGRRRLVLSGGN